MKHLNTLVTLSAVALLSVPVLAQDSSASARGGSSGGSGGGTTVSSSTTVTPPQTAPVAPAPGTGSSTTLEATTDTLTTDTAVSDQKLPNGGGSPAFFVLGGIALMGSALVLRRQSAKNSAALSRQVAKKGA